MKLLRLLMTTVRVVAKMRKFPLVKLRLTSGSNIDSTDLKKSRSFWKNGAWPLRTLPLHLPGWITHIPSSCECFKYSYKWVFTRLPHTLCCVPEMQRLTLSSNTTLSRKKGYNINKNDGKIPLNGVHFTKTSRLLKLHWNLNLIKSNMQRNMQAASMNFRSHNLCLEMLLFLAD